MLTGDSHCHGGCRRTAGVRDRYRRGTEGVLQPGLLLWL
jgi:hypothetical protein